jgi:hypothetical protein
MYIFMKMIFKINLLYDFHISKLNDLKVSHHLYSQCLTQILSKTTSFTKPKRVCILLGKYFARQIYSCSFHISKLNDLKVIHDLYFQCLTQSTYSFGWLLVLVCSERKVLLADC